LLAKQRGKFAFSVVFARASRCCDMRKKISVKISLLSQLFIVALRDEYGTQLTLRGTTNGT
jgi:hypothetical protein